MTSVAKLAFSPQEAELIQNHEWILTKQSALGKIEELFAEQVEIIKGNFPFLVKELGAVASSKPKISRGEKYLGLPWVMLDYPAVFGKDDIFAVRTMFWWGHFFSVTLHLSGSYKKLFEEKVRTALTSDKDSPFYLSVGADQWAHHFDGTNYRPTPEYLAENLPNQRSNFLKVALKFPLNEWEKMESNLLYAYRNIFALLR